MFTCLFRNVFFGAALVNFAVCALSIANRIKIEVRDEPVFPRDFALLKEAGSAVGTYDIQFPVPSIAVIVVFSLVLVALGLFAGSRPFPIARLRGWVGSLLGAAASFAVLAGLIVTVYASNDLYNSFRVSNAYYIPSVFNELGFPYCFCHQFTTYPVDKPEGFSRSEAAGWDQGGETGLGKDVNVIMVMDEAFSDITDSDAFAFSADGHADQRTRRRNHLLLPGGESEPGQPVPGLRRRWLPHLLLPPGGRLVLQPGERLPLVRGGGDRIRRPDGGAGIQGPLGHGRLHGGPDRTGI